MESDSKSVLEFLISKGEIPSFSFPLDTTVFAAEETKKAGSDVRHIVRYSRDTKLAISELAPGRTQTVNGERLTIGGLYFEFSKDRVNRALEFWEDFNQLTENRVSICLNKYCGWVSGNKKDDLTQQDCPICTSSTDPSIIKNNVRTYLLLKPEAMSPISVPHDFRSPRPRFDTTNSRVRPIKNNQTTKNSKRATGRAKLPAPDTGDISDGEPMWIGATKWKRCSLYLGKDENEGKGIEFVLLNSGPNEEGFEFCEKCGSSLPANEDEKNKQENVHHRPYIVTSKHLKSYPSDEKRKLKYGCDGHKVITPSELPICLGLRFRSDIAVFRFNLDMELEHPEFNWSQPEFHGAIIALRDAIQTKIIEKLGLMNRELSSGYRLVYKNDKRILDIYVYDSVSGGAGLVTQLQKLTGEIEDLLDDALNHLDGRSCLEMRPCSRACIGCLLDFKNRIDHDVVNRPLGRSLGMFFRDGRIPEAGDFGRYENDEIDRLDSAIRSYETWLGDGIGIGRDGSKIIDLSGNTWEIVSTLMPEKIDEYIMRIDTLESYPEVITNQLGRGDEEFSMPW